MKSLLFLLFINYSTFYYSQTDSTNRFDSQNKKTGYWKQFLDENLFHADSVNAYFYGYEYFENGTALFGFVKDGFKKRNQGKFSVAALKKGQPQILNGEFVWFTGKDSTEYVKEIYNNGHPVVFMTIQNGGCISEYIDYTSLYQNQTGSYYFETCSCNFDRCEAFWSYKMGKKMGIQKIDNFRRSEQKTRLKHIEKAALMKE